MDNFKERYSERQCIYRSQWADTYRAVNSITKDIVTLKVIINNSNNEEFIDNLKEEVKILKNMENSNLICINTMGKIMGQEKGYFYIESEKFPGTSLKERLKNGTFSEVEAIKILKQVAEGLKEFHFESLVYGQLSCDNIYINEKGIIKIDTLAYFEGKGLATPGKEEFNGEEDIYSLGLILFELVSGKSDFKPGKYKDEISDKDILYIIEKCTNKKLGIYEDLNKFVEDANKYLECSKESTPVIEEKEMIEKEIIEEEIIEEEIIEEENDEVIIKKNPYKITPFELIRNLAVCFLAFLLVATTINGGSLFKNKKKEEAISTKPPVTNEVKEETPEEETPVVEPASQEDNTYSQPDYSSDDSYNNDTSNGYPNNNNTNNNGNNTGNNGGNNNGGGQYPGEDNTETPDDTTTPGDGSGEETPTPEPTPEPTPDPIPEPTPDPGNGDTGSDLENQ